jgi:hypothetical protein
MVVWAWLIIVITATAIDVNKAFHVLNAICGKDNMTCRHNLLIMDNLLFFVIQPTSIVTVKFLILVEQQAHLPHHTPAPVVILGQRLFRRTGSAVSCLSSVKVLTIVITLSASACPNRA